MLLLLAPALYAALLVWLRGGLVGQAAGSLPLTLTSPPSPLSCGEGELASNFRLVLATSSPSPQERGLGGEVSVKGKLPVGEEVPIRGAQAPPRFSVLIAARDEAAALPHLLEALSQQTLPPHLFEVLIADDHSADGTAALVRAAARAAPFALRLVALPPGATGKKAALAAAEAQARAAWAVCTDADCRPAPGWLRAYAELLQGAATPLHFVSGPVRLTPGGAWFDGLLGLEFAGLGGVGAGCIGRGRPTMCNGANLAFRRRTFQAVGGYADNAGLASGDDEFLLHKIHQRYPAGVRFLADPRALVDTPAPATLRALLRQRVRWASKWPHYRSAAPRRLAVLVLAANVSLALGLGLALRWPALGPWAGAAWLLKLGADAWLLAPMLALLGRRRWLAWLLPLQVLYVPYALAVALAARRGAYRWKGRQVR